MIDVELTHGGQQAVFAGIASAQSYGKADYFIAGVVARLARQLVEQLAERRIAHRGDGLWREGACVIFLAWRSGYC